MAGTGTAAISIFLVGKTGSGKSTSGNMILQREVFDTSVGFSSGTQECSLRSGTVLGSFVQVMDTPGLFDTGSSHEEVGLRIVQCVINLHPGPDVIFYVIRIGEKYTAEDFAGYRRFKMLLGSNVTHHMIVLFTGGDKLAKSGKTLEQFLHNIPDHLLTVLRESGGRCAVLNNELTFAQGLAQVASLLDRAQQLRQANLYRPYACHSYGKIAHTLGQVAALRTQVERKLREVERQEVRASQYLQQREAEYKQTLDRLQLSQAEYDRRLKDFEQQMEEEKRRRLDAWLQKIEQEERALKARKEEEERRLLAERMEHERRLQRQREEHERQMREEQERQRRLQEEERERQRRAMQQMEAEEAERQRVLAERRRELRQREREAAEAAEQRNRTQQRMRTALLVMDVCRLALRILTK